MQTCKNHEKSQKIDFDIFDFFVIFMIFIGLHMIFKKWLFREVKWLFEYYVNSREHNTIGEDNTNKKQEKKNCEPFGDSNSSKSVKLFSKHPKFQFLSIQWSNVKIGGLITLK